MKSRGGVSTQAVDMRAGEQTKIRKVLT